MKLPRHIQKLILNVLILLLVYSTVSLGAAESNDRLLSCELPSIPGDKVHIFIENEDISGAELVIPRPYLMSIGVRDGGKRKTLLLSVRLDNFLPYTARDADSRENKQRFARGERIGTTLLISRFLQLEESAKRFTGALNYERPSGGKPFDLDGTLLRNGLFGQKLPAKPDFSDVYLGKHQGQITDVILCDQLGQVPFPSCSHVMEAAGYGVKITYPVNELENWRIYRRHTETLLGCLTVKQPRKKSP